MTIDPKSVGVMVNRRLCLTDAITHEGEVFFVLLWFSNKSEGQKRPEYVIHQSKVRHQDIGVGGRPCRYMISDPLPASLFDGTASRQERRQFGVRRGPDVTYPLETKPH
ncbi:hypothetical protein GA830_10970 [Mesorhizobium sp. NBSH29]|uniref:hypothetical protein n=1 Tax=Mesorhizobium sp. NBSH29 TaxID=2654249 RepID=UPI0018C1672C|nr:hypothetical protein [Mesorhizobium sp. NBSH29]QPC87203.1 hypothetical protein GA830_10970 [Mesorhizobium sp. NBSH29]